MSCRNRNVVEEVQQRLEDVSENGRAEIRGGDVK